MVRAKFYCLEKTLNTAVQDKGFLVKLLPVIDGSAENKEFYKWTPGGYIELSIVHGAAADQFQPGEYYYVDFSKAIIE